MTSQLYSKYLLPWVMLGAVLAIGFSCVGVNDPDTWWLLADGRRILGGDFSHNNAYSFLFPDYYWPQGRWLFSVLLAATVRICGVDGLQFVPVLLSLALTMLLIDSSVRMGKRFVPELFFPLFLLVMTSARLFFVPRAHLASWLGLLLLLNLWQRKNSWFPLQVAVVALFWTNTHPGVIEGFGLLTLITISAVLSKNTREAGMAWVSLVAFFLASLINPFGFQNYRDFISIVSSLGHNTLTIGEFQPPVLWAHPSFLLFVGLTIFSLRTAWRDHNLLFLLVSAVFFPLAFRSMRFIPESMFLAMPYLYANLSSRFSGETLPARRRLKLGSFIGIAVSVCIFQLSIWLPLMPPRFGVDWRDEPAGSADFVERTGLHGRMFNDYNLGGFLTWRLFPDRKVFIDGRGPAAYPQDFCEEYSSAQQMPAKEFEVYLEKYGIDFALIQRGGRWMPSGAFEHVFDVLRWDLVYIEGVAYVYVNPRKTGISSLPLLPFRYLRPGLPEETLFGEAIRNPEAVLQELRRISPKRLIVPEDFRRFGVAAFLAGDHGLAEIFLSEGLEQHPEDPAILYHAARVADAKGDRTGAARLMRKAAKSDSLAPETQLARKWLQTM